MAKIINNFQVTVRNIHVRYEDSLSCPGVSSAHYNGFRPLLILPNSTHLLLG
jgi:hypothetical protein